MFYLSRNLSPTKSRSMRSIQRSIESLQSEISEIKKSNPSLASVTSQSELNVSTNQDRLSFIMTHNL